MPSFDVVSKVDLTEVDNAINGVKRETQQRFDLKGTKAGVDRSGQRAHRNRRQRPATSTGP